MVKIAIFAILAILPPGACPSGTVRATRPGPQDRQVRAPDPPGPSDPEPSLPRPDPPSPPGPTPDPGPE